MPTPHPDPSFRPGARRRPTGFTLVELLVVIGIIVLLVAILLPTISKARIVAAGAKTQASMVSISSAIERYYGDERAYPGIIPNARISGAAPGPYKPEPAGQPLTMSENLVLTLCGGLQYNKDAPADPLYVRADVGKGPMNLSTSPTKRTRRPPYLDVSAGKFLSSTWVPDDGSGGSVANGTDDLTPFGTPKAGGTVDSNVPEFVDDYTDERPILYMRAVVGAPDSVTGATDYDSDAVQYNKDHVVLRYGRDTDPVSDGDFAFDNLADTPQGPSFREYLKHPSIPNSPRGKDKYVLIGAGRDRQFGTPDDYIVGG